MIAAASSDLALCRRTALLQQTVALALQPVASQQEHTQLIQNLLALESLDSTIEAAINQHLTHLYAARDALGLLLELLEETDRPMIPTASIVSLLAPWHEDVNKACRGISALF